MDGRTLGHRPTRLEVVVSQMRHLRIMIALGATTLVAALAPAAQANEVSVCNQAGNGHLGGDYVATDNDPAPPARHKTGLRTLGNGKGLTRAAQNSPALSACEVPGGGPTVE